MAVMMMAELPGATTAMYDEVNEQMGISQDNLPEGLIAHQAGVTDGALVIVDVWESQEAFERFAREKAGPTLERLGVPDMQPRVLPIHNFIERGQGTQANVMMIVEMPSLGPDAYDAMAAGMSAHQGGGSNHPAVSHAVARANGGLLVVDVWDSPESFMALAREQIAESGVDLDAIGAIEPRFVPIHNRFARS